MIATLPAVNPADHIGLVHRIARTVRPPPGLEREDLIAEGLLALCRAAREYDPTRGVRFSSFAWPVVERALWRLCHLHRRLPATKQLPEMLTDRPSRAEGDTSVSDATLRLLRRLPRRERQVVTLLYGLDGQGERVQREAAALLGVSQARVQQRLQKALVRLRR